MHDLAVAHDQGLARDLVFHIQLQHPLLSQQMLEEGCNIKAGVVLDASDGPIIIKKGTII